jgi:hypothetical protein
MLRYQIMIIKGIQTMGMDEMVGTGRVPKSYLIVQRGEL